MRRTRIAVTVTVSAVGAEAGGYGARGDPATGLLLNPMKQRRQPWLRVRARGLYPTGGVGYYRTMQGVPLNTGQRARFLESLAKTANVTASAAAINLTRKCLYDHRRADPEFATAWDVAIEIATDALEAEARRRALDGVSRPMVSAGKVVRDDNGEVIMIREYSDTLMLAQLKAYRGNQYREKSSVDITGKLSLEQLVGAAVAKKDDEGTSS